MKKKITELLKKRRVAAGLTAIVLAVAVGSVSVVQQKSQIPELPVYTDPEMETNIEEEETPLPQCWLKLLQARKQQLRK